MTVAGLTLWPVKSMAGGVDVDEARAEASGLVGDRRRAVLLDGRPLSARKAPGLLRWTAGADGTVTAPDGAAYAWGDPALDAALSADLGHPVTAADVPGGAADLAASVLVTTAASTAELAHRYGAPLEHRRWRTNVHLALDAGAFAEEGWEGRALHVGGDDGVVLRLLHPCRRCTITTWAPGGRARTPDLLRWIVTEHSGVLGINARVERPGVLRTGDAVALV